jgi:YggT family protein
VTVSRDQTGQLEMFILGSIIDWVLWVFLLLLFARMILSWVPVLVRDWEPRGPMLVVAEIIYSITDPPLRMLRKVLRPVRIGNIMLDLAFIGLTIIVLILREVNGRIFFG